MVLFGAIFLVVALVLIGVGVVLGLVGAALAMLLLGFGVISSSFLVGMRTRSAHAGVRTFLLLASVLTGIPAGMICAWLAVSFLEWSGTTSSVLICGAASGAIVGLAIAVLAELALRKSAGWLTSRFTVISRRP